ncbi:type II toxin-antitoxin system Phd/YefM family antitoxin [Gloeocapsa sp. PCC 73106]|uniref:type II toxin-antitoxin system Phd/YefM family antitoxin n=1 Tax=Gloeocapsa sp. PCC 73106 TaxID=102232 RepID=UPI0002ACA9AA|nr:type II toxin-antitoxin system prevent-host-death family antitoxin [Gloeocapsa sp. PCC 73106]ELR97744.1 prevent-host-death family protein [Gloeocapsa sp. PCC 73106]
MTIHINQQDAENNFPKLLSKVLEGEEIIISMNGKEIAKILPCQNQENKDSSKEYRKTGLLKGKLSESFFEPLPEEELKLWEQDI